MLSPIIISDGQVSGVDSLSTAASSVMNWDVDEAGVNRVRPALVQHALTNVTTDPIVGAEWWNGYLMLVTQSSGGLRSLWAVSDSVPGYAQQLSDESDSTTLLGGLERPVFAAGANHIYVAGGDRLLKWGPDLIWAEEVTTSPYCTHVASLGQRLLTNDLEYSGVYRWSDIGESVWATWPALNRSNADARPDPIVGVYENVNEALIWGDTTLQAYAVGSDPSFPFERVSSINTGLAAPYCVVRLDEKFAFLDQNRRIVQSDGRMVEPFSDAIDKDLRGLSTVSDAWGYREEIGQHSRLVFRFPTAARTFVFDMKGKRWSERDYYTAPFTGDWPAGAYAKWPTSNLHMIGLTSGGLRYLSIDTRSDHGSVPIVCSRVTGWHDHGSKKRKRSIRIRLALRRGTASEGATPGALEVRHQNDDGPWSPWESVSVGTPSQYNHVVDLYPGGIFYRRRYQFRFSTTEDISLVEAHDDVMELAT